MPAIKTYICKTKCFFNKTLYTPSNIKIYSFPSDMKIPKHFIEVGDKPSMALNQALEKYEKELEMLKKQKNPHKSILDKIKMIEARIKAVKGVEPDSEPDTDKDTDK
jgi:hypothetical protein